MTPDIVTSFATHRYSTLTIERDPIIQVGSAAKGTGQCGTAPGGATPAPRGLVEDQVGWMYVRQRSLSGAAHCAARPWDLGW